MKDFSFLRLHGFLHLPDIHAYLNIIYICFKYNYVYTMGLRVRESSSWTLIKLLISVFRETNSFELLT